MGESAFEPGKNDAKLRRISFCIPCYRSEKTVSLVVDEIRATMSQAALKWDYEIVCVNDCSPDGVQCVLEGLAQNDPHVKVIELSANKGKHTALLAAFGICTGDIAVCVDDDGQSPVSCVWELVSALDDGADVAMADYGASRPGGFKGLCSDANDWLSRVLFRKPEGVRFSNFSARRRFVYKAMACYTNPFPYLEGLTLQITRRITMVPMAERRRIAGESGFTFSKGLGLLVNGAVSFSLKPLRAIGFFGCFLMVLSVALLFTGVTRVDGTIFGFSASLLCAGLVFIALSLMGEYVGRAYMSISGLPQYTIRSIVGCSEEEFKRKCASLSQDKVHGGNE